jgi:glycosyltransferase involved in cell wall biosynthesis
MVAARQTAFSAASLRMSALLVLDTKSLSFDAPFVPVLPMPGVGIPGVGDRLRDVSSLPAPSVFALHLVDGEHYCGAERVQDLLAKQLPRYGCEVGFVCVKPQRFPNARETKTAPLIEMPTRNRYDFRVVKRLAELIRSEAYDLVHAHTPRAAIVGRLAARSAGVPFVYHVHSLAGRESTHRLLKWFNATAVWTAVRGADRLIAVSPNMRDYMIACGISADRIVCVPNGVPITNIRVERRPPTETWTLGAIALFRPRKGIEVLLEALAVLRSRNVNVRLRAVGGFETPQYKAQVLRFADRLGLAEAIDWIGFTRSVNRELAKINLFTLPGLVGDGLPMAVLEAMAAGLPVVASRVEGVPAAVVHRETGLLVEPGSVSQLVQAIEEVIGGGVDYSALSRGARAHHAESFSDTTMAARVAKVYREILVAK